MDEINISTVETRRFSSPAFLASVEVEFHRRALWLDSFYPARSEQVEGSVLARVVARAAVTGALTPPLVLFERSGMPVVLDYRDTVDVALAVASIGRMPPEGDYPDGITILRLRETLESSLGLKLSHLALRGRHREADEAKIELVAGQLSDYSIPVSHSPELSFAKFAELLAKNRRIWGFTFGADTLLGTTALASAYQLAISANPILAIELAAAGATAYLVLKFGAAVGKRIEELVRR